MRWADGIRVNRDDIETGRRLDLLHRRHTRERVRSPVVCRLQGRDYGGRFQGAGRRTIASGRNRAASDAVRRVITLVRRPWRE